MTQYARQVDPASVARADGATVRVRVGVRPLRKARDAYEAEKFGKVDANRVIVRGRWSRAGLVWDVLRILGPGKVEAYALGCSWRDEAISLAGDCLAGRVRVALGSIGRTGFVARGSLFAPDRALAARPMFDLKPLDGSKDASECMAFEVTPRQQEAVPALVKADR